MSNLLVSKSREKEKYLKSNSLKWRNDRKTAVNKIKSIYEYAPSQYKLLAKKNANKWKYENIVKSSQKLQSLSNVREKFEHLAAEWERETCYKSLMNEIVMHEAYQQIIGMGSAVIPLLLEDLNKPEPRHWFWALKAITGTSPIEPQHRGRVKKMAEDWLKWGKANGYEFRQLL